MALNVFHADTTDETKICHDKICLLILSDNSAFKLRGYQGIAPFFGGRGERKVRAMVNTNLRSSNCQK